MQDTNTTYKYYSAPLAILLLLSSSFVVGLSKPNVSTNHKFSTNLNKRLEAKYHKDATRLALRLLSDEKDIIDLKAEVPEEMVQSIFEALVAVHQSDSPKAAEVTRTHKLHTFPMPSIDQFFVIYHKNADWCQPLRLGGNTTDNDSINEILSQYNLMIDKHMEWDEEHNSFNVRAKTALNMAPLAQLFSTLNDVLLVDLLIPDGDGNDIEIKPLENGWELNYHVKFGTCITGCKKERVWTFEVMNNEVSFIKERGDELPLWMKKHG